MCTSRFQTLAPSTLAALYRSAGIDFIVTSSRMVASGTSFQTKALAISASVLSASPSQTMYLSMKSSWYSRPLSAP